MGKLPLLNAREMINILKKLRFELKRQEGSHMFFEHLDGSIILRIAEALGYSSYKGDKVRYEIKVYPPK